VYGHCANIIGTKLRDFYMLICCKDTAHFTVEILAKVFAVISGLNEMKRVTSFIAFFFIHVSISMYIEIRHKNNQTYKTQIRLSQKEDFVPFFASSYVFIVYHNVCFFAIE